MKGTRWSHGEAFCMMRYRGEVTGKLVVVWNSRDGVTPFMFHLDGEPFKHVDWDLDQCVPKYVPKAGDLLFRSIAREEAEELARERASYFWSENVADARQRYGSVEELASALVDSLHHQGEAPVLVRVERDGDARGAIVRARPSGTLLSERERLEREIRDLLDALVALDSRQGSDRKAIKGAQLRMRELCTRYVELHDFCGRETLPAIPVPGLEDVSQPEKGGR